MLPPDGGPLSSIGTRALRASLTTGGYWWLPEVTGRKLVPKPYSDWRTRTEPFDPALDYTNAYGLLLNTALVTLGLVTLDLDVDDPADVSLALAIMAEHLGPPRCVRSRSNSARKAVIYRTDDAAGLYACQKGSDGAIELFAGPMCKLTAFGTHIDKVTQQRTRLCWSEVPGNVARAELPAVTLAQTLAYLEAVAEVLGDDVRLRSHVPGRAGAPNLSGKADDIDEMVRAASFIPNTGQTDWHEWNRIGLALYAASAGDDRGLLAFAEWSHKNPATRHRNWSDRWDAYKGTPPSRIGAGTIFHLAYQHGYRRSPTALAPIGQPTRTERRASRSLANFTPEL